MEAAKKQKEAPRTATAPMSIDAAEPQSFWMDQQGNIYYATGFPGVEKGKAPSSPIPIKPGEEDQHRAAVNQQALPSSRNVYADNVVRQGQAEEPTPITSFLQHQQSWAMANMYESPVLYGEGGGYIDEASAAAYYAQQMAGQYPTDMVRPPSEPRRPNPR